jgi:hypothetical protein
VADQYPEHAKLRAVKPQCDVIGEFLDWPQSPVGGRRVVGMWRPHFCLLCSSLWTDRREGEAVYCASCGTTAFHKSEDLLLSAPDSTLDLLARYFEIDQNKLEAENRQILDALRAANGEE